MLASPPELRWRDQQHLPVPTQHICSPYDPEARWANKGSRTWVGYKVFLTENCDPDQPRLITHVATPPASIADETMVKPIHTALAEADLLAARTPDGCGRMSRVEHVVDSPKQ